MRLVTAIIRAERLDDAKTALQALGVEGMTVTETRGFGRQRGHVEMYRGTEHRVEFSSKIRIEVLMDDDMVPKALDAIVAAARTGKIGDGKIWITPVDGVYRIRTGEAGSAAL